jgi:hypothetical protein
VLGRLDAEYFLGGEIHLDVGAARRAIQTLAGQLGLGVEDATSSSGASEHGGEAQVARARLGVTAAAGLSTSRQAFMPPHACLWRSLGRHAFRIAPAPPVDHAHRPLHCKVPVSRHVSLLWTGRVHGPYPLIITERPSELKPNAAMFHGASRECPPRDPRILNRSVTGVDEVFRRNQKKYAEATVYDASQSGPPGF